MSPELGHRGEDDAPNPKCISGVCDAGQLRGRRQTKDVVSDRGGEGDRQKTWALMRPGCVCGGCVYVCVCVFVCKEHEGPHLLLSTAGLSLCLKELG